MATYKHESGETVIAVDGSWEDTRIGSLALDGKGGWSKVDESEPAAPAPATGASTKPSAPKPKPEG